MRQGEQGECAQNPGLEPDGGGMGGGDQTGAKAEGAAGEWSPRGWGWALLWTAGGPASSPQAHLWVSPIGLFSLALRLSFPAQAVSPLCASGSYRYNKWLRYCLFLLN